MWLSKFRAFMISSQNCAGSKQHKITTTQIFAKQDKAKANTDNRSG
jgi:hypothetical protein